MQVVCGQMLVPAVDGRVKPFSCSAAPESVAGEGSAFFLLTRDSVGRSYARMEPRFQDGQGERPQLRAMQILDACGMAKSEENYLSAVRPGIPVAGYAPIFGSQLTGSAFHAAAAAVMMKARMQYASPVLENPHGLNLCRETKSAELDEIFCTRLDCSGQVGTIVVGR
jgi:hypothetical protein